MNSNQPCRGVELVSPCSFPTTITVTQLAPLILYTHTQCKTLVTNRALRYPIASVCLHFALISVLTYVTEIVEQLDTKSNQKLGGFRSQLEASCVSNHTETVSLWMTVYTITLPCAQRACRVPFDPAKSTS